ncbi:HAD family hydrolase [Pseudoxanthomonas indica]|uniref:Putative hydrolase of the HAD superfamily n=1 Tax=Pseudoxanthomonas indica TaxID=428993 RepID=A0A1T5K2Z1_9GAMM|nr:HAD family hydrolase [Pseudoxanthomonas indica]GGD46193.1 haloacid dehalogenase [Pseudoxanthomonas indica]SKC58003.1 putative hydrolase of the HAD superfamily [Pseudoxanthomonas indica]
MADIRWVGFDGDDTLWKSEDYYRQAEHDFEQILAGYLDLEDRRMQQHLLETERRNLKVFGYGVKGMTLSMIESAIQLTDERISARDLHRVMEIGRACLQHPVDLLPGIREAVEAVARDHEIVLITKGDLFHQEAKIAQSGLADLFHRIEVVSEKDEATYARVLQELGVHASQFVMVGNSLRSDIEPVIQLGGWGIHMPYHVTWALETEHGLGDDVPRLHTVTVAAQIPSTLASIRSQ